MKLWQVKYKDTVRQTRRPTINIFFKDIRHRKSVSESKEPADTQRIKEALSEDRAIKKKQN